jgi:hypothetical protein
MQVCQVQIDREKLKKKKKKSSDKRTVGGS